MAVKEFKLHAEQWLPRSIGEIFPFFAKAANLETLTPPFLSFEILTPESVDMRVGALIDYRLRIHGFPIRWRTEIAAWEPPHRFIDVQMKGPYRLWHHTHTFEEKDGGTLCTDDVRYHPIGGSLVNALFVRRDVETIFAYRRQRLSELFGPRKM